MRFIRLCLLVLIIGVSGTVSAKTLQTWPGSLQDKPALQNGALIFVRQCVACHGGTSVSPEHLRALGFTDPEMLRELQPHAQEQTGRLQPAAEPEVLRQTFGTVPPDLATYLRARQSAQLSGADWGYTFLRSFHPDTKSRTGWNNTLVPGTAMPNVLNGLPETVLRDKRKGLENGTLQKAEQDGFDKRVSDLVAYLVWMSGLGQKSGQKVSDFAEVNPGFAVAAFLALLLGLAYALKRNYWQGVR